MLFNHKSKYYRLLQVGIRVAISLTEVCDELLGTLGASLDRFFPRREKQGAETQIEPELTLRRLRERLRLINPHWPPYPNAVGIIVGDFNICDPEEGRFNVSRHSQIVTRERQQCFTPFFHLSLRLLNLITRGGTPQPLGSYALYQGLIASLLTYLWLRREIFTATPMSSRTW